MNKEQQLEGLKILNKSEWFVFLDHLFLHQTLPGELVNPFDTATEYLEALHRYCNELGRLDLKYVIEKRTIEYYQGLPLNSTNYKRIYSLLFLFSEINPQVNETRFLATQFYERRLIGHYFNEAIHLHSYLLRVLTGLSTIDHDVLISHLFQCINEPRELYDNQFFYAATESFRKHKPQAFFEVIELVLFEVNTTYVEESLATSIIDHTREQGSFLPVFSWLDQNWMRLITVDATIDFRPFSAFCDALNERLNYNKPYFRKDGFAKMVKIKLTSKHRPPPPKVIEEAYESEAVQVVVQKEDGKAIQEAIDNTIIFAFRRHEEHLIYQPVVPRDNYTGGARAVLQLVAQSDELKDKDATEDDLTYFEKSRQRGILLEPKQQLEDDYKVGFDDLRLGTIKNPRLIKLLGGVAVTKQDRGAIVTALANAEKRKELTA